MTPFKTPIPIQFDSTQIYSSIPAKITYTNMIKHKIKTNIKHIPKFMTKSSQQAAAAAAVAAAVAVAAG